MVATPQRRRTSDSDALARAVEVLRADGVVILPTETLYGFSCRARSSAALGRIQRLKAGDPPTSRRGFVALIDSFARLGPELAPEQEPRALELLRSLWPEALTAVVRTKHAVPWGERLDSGNTAAFRVPKHDWLLQLLGLLEEPLVSTSVNRAGQAPRTQPDEMLREFGAEIDLIVTEDGVTDDGAADHVSESSSASAAPALTASTLVDCTQWPPRILARRTF